MINILMIEDDPDFSLLLGSFLKKYDMQITNITDPFYALSLDFDKYDLLILDLGLDGIDGLDVCKFIKEKKYNIPIIISSARSDIDDKEICFSNGANDYLAKPYNPKEMYLRINNLLNIYSKKVANIEYKFYIRNNDIFYDNNILTLTKAEYEVLFILIKNYNQTLSREQIINSCYSLNDEYGKTLNTIVGRIRNKTKQDSIVTIRGIGYRINK